MQPLTRTPLVFALLATPAAAQLAVYDFNDLNGSDTYPYTPLDGQDGWSEETFNAPNPCGVTETLGFDGTECLRFQEVGPGFGTDASRVNDPNFQVGGYQPTETMGILEFELHLGFWGGGLGYAYDLNGNGQVRGSEAGERGVRIWVGTNTNVGLQLVAADQTVHAVPLAGIAGGGEWVRLQLTMDMTANSGAGLGSLQYQNLTQGQTGFQPVPGLQGIDLALDFSANDARNPSNWNALFLHFEGATYMLDNVVVGGSDLTGSYCGPAVPNSTGASAAIVAVGSSLVADNDVTLRGLLLPPNQFGLFLCSQNQGFIPGPGGSMGNLCLSGGIGRYNASAGYGTVNSGSAGFASLVLDLTNTPTPGGSVAIQPGETWNFQLWYRDLVGGSPTSNFTDGISLGFQ